MVGEVRRALRLVESRRRLLVLGSAVAAVQSALLLPVALIVRDVFDQRIPDGDERGIVVAGLLILGLYTASAVLGMFARRAVVAATKPAVGRMRRELLVRLLALPRAWHDRQDSAQLHATLVHDSERVDLMLAHLATPVLPAAIVATALGIVAIILNPLLAAVVAVIVPLMAAAAQWLHRRTREAARAQADSFHAYSASIQRSLRTLPLAKAHAAEEVEVERVGESIEALTTTGQRVVAAHGMHQALQGAIAAAAASAVLIVGGVAVTRGSMTLGDLLAFYAIIGLMIRQFGALTLGADHLLAGAIAHERIEALLAVSEPEPYSGRRSPPKRALLALEDVTFGYGEEPVLTGIDLTLGPGERVALIGPNGAGKSTVVKLILGLYRPQSGRLSIGGVPYEELDLRALRARTGVVLQDAFLFAGTVSQNIAFGLTDARPDSVRRAAVRATADDLIRKLPSGYDSEVGDEGTLLSGGLGQRIALARALIVDPEWLVLDEPTTYLHDEAIPVLMDNLRALPAAPAVLVVTHDPVVAAYADRVVHLRNGRVESDLLTQR